MKKIIPSFILIAVVLFCTSEILNKKGEAIHTGSPGEFDCTGCHTSFAVNSGPGSVSISIPSMTNWQYVPGTVYPVSVTVAQTSVPLFGFGFEALKTSNNTSTGTFTITNSTQTQLKAGTVNGSSRTNVVHKQDGGLTANTHTFTFNWTAPSAASNPGNIMFYFAGNASDHNDDTLNDYIYTGSQLITKQSSVGVNEISNGSLLKAYYNSLQHVLTLVFPDNFSSSSFCNVAVCNAAGRIIFNKMINHLSADDPLNLELPSNLANGIYFLKCELPEKSFSTKIFVSK